jgi:uncharacterized protein (DUF952 family)
LEFRVTVFFKIVAAKNWAEAQLIGSFEGSALDLKDGYIHLSTVEQVQETARLHFAGQADLVLVAVSESAVAKHLKWEASRGGTFFPHVYAPLDPAQCLWAKSLPWNGTSHDFPVEFNP